MKDHRLKRVRLYKICIPADIRAEKLLAARLCILLGSMAAGVIEAMCAAQPLDWTAHYFQAWSKLFAATGPQATIDLFGIQYLTLVFAATVLLLLGFSALGPVLIFLFAMFYGLGSGMLTVQLFELQRNAGRLLVALLPAAVAADGLCIFGANALRVSGQIRACSFSLRIFVRGTGESGSIR